MQQDPGGRGSKTAAAYGLQYIVTRGLPRFRKGEKSMMRGIGKRLCSFLLSSAMVVGLTGGMAPLETKAAAASDKLLDNEHVEADTANMDQYAKDESGQQAKFGWYTWNFDIDPEMDTVGVEGDGVGTLYFRLFEPENQEDGEKYPFVATLGGLGSTNAFANNGYASMGSAFAGEKFQQENPCYVLNITVPYEAAVNYEAEAEYIYQFGEIIKAAEEAYGNIDDNRIYATGHSQGAGWTYELISLQPDLLAAAVINAGTTIHTTWGDQCDMDALAKSPTNLYIWHGYEDPYIPVNEAFRAWNTLKAKGKTNIVFETEKYGHVKSAILSADGTSYMSWMFDQTKDKACEPSETIRDSYADYDWAGFRVLSEVDGWATSPYDYSTWTEQAENETWKQVQENHKDDLKSDKTGGTGKTWLAKVRIGDETATSYDLASTGTLTIDAGDSLAVTIQGYTGGC